MVIQCCMCHKVRRGEGWVKVRDAARVSRSASHTFCPVCETEFRRKWGLLD